MNEPELYDKEAELITLGCILVDPELFPCLYSILKPQDFCYIACRHTWQAMINLSKRNVPPDQYLVARELQDMGFREDIPFLSRMVYLCPTSYHLQYYAAVVKKFAERRAKLWKAGQIAREAFEETKTIRGIEL